MTDRRFRAAQVILALLGLASAGYLTYTKYAHDGVCGVSAGCTIVQNSPWSELYGIPVSVLGVLGYVGILGALLVAPQRNDVVRLSLVVMSGVGFLFSMFLMYRAYITLEAFCPFCTTSAVVMTLLAITSTARFLRGPDPQSRDLRGADGAAEITSGGPPVIATDGGPASVLHDPSPPRRTR